MRTLLSGLSILFFALPAVSGQGRTYIGIDAGPNWDINRVADAGNYFSQSTTFGSVIGVSLWQEVISNLFLGSGVYYHTYYSGINLDDQRPVRAAWQSFSSVLIPARISYRIQPSEFPFGLTAKAGYQLGIITGNRDPYVANSRIASPDGTLIQYSYTEGAPAASAIHLLEFGASIDYLFQNNWKAGVEFTHYSGLRDMYTADLDYSDGTSSFNSAYFMDGGRIQATMNLFVPVSNIWANRDLRIRNRIENSGWRGSDVRQKRYIYFGGDVGSLWRMFRSSNPSIGPRPLEGRGVFRFANLRAGGYFGYMFNERVGVDIGASYQRSSTFLALMYDHEADLIVRERAPFFLEIPVMFRYHYPLYKKTLHLVPSLGLSGLTHFSGAGYSSGSGTFQAGSTGVNVTYTASRISRIGVSVRSGIGLEYKLPVRLPLVSTTYLHYNHGLIAIDQTDITTTLSETPAISTLQYAGTGWSLSVGLKVPILLGRENRRCGAQMPTR